jgi:predicted nuclease of predicted toxin-antitoxin system
VKVLVDENIPRRTVNWLIERGDDVKDLRRTPQQGLADAELWELAQLEKRLLISTDRWFLRYRNTSHSGVLVVLLSQPERLRIHAKVIQVLERFAPEEWPGLTVRARDHLQSIRRWRSGNAEGAG